MAIGQHAAADLIARAAAVGIDIDAEIVRTGQSIPGHALSTAGIEKVGPEGVAARIASNRRDKVAMFNRRQGDDLEARIAARERSANQAVQAVAPAGETMATERQVQYIHELRARRARNGEGDGFMTFTGDPAMLTRREASSYIDSLRGEY